jgi:L-threonylcarbamoyladenylate synthase
VVEIIPAAERDTVEYAAHLLRQGELIVCPTDTVYGIGAAVSDEQAIRRLYSIKGRSPDKPLPLLIADAADVTKIAEPPAVARKLMDRFWPGALTIVMRRRQGFRSLALAGQDTVGLRVPDEDVTRDIIHTLGEPITGTSANRSGQAAPTSAQQAAMQLGDLVSVVIDGGPRRGGQESTVIDITHDSAKIVRRGAVSREELQAVLGGALE